MTQKPDHNSVVAKSNELIVQMAKFGLSELRLIAYCLAHFDSRDNVNNLISARVNDLTELFPMDEKSAYAVVRQVMIGIGKKPLEVKLGNRHKYRNWFSGFDYIEGIGAFEFMINPDVQPYLLDLKGNFTRYRLGDVYQFKAASTWKLYELLKKWESARNWSVDLDELRLLLGVAGKYLRWDSFKRQIDKSTSEINKTSDINIEYEKVKHGRSVVSLSFSIQPAKADDVTDLKTPKTLLCDELRKLGVNNKTAENYARKAEDLDKIEHILNKLPKMIKRAKQPKQKYVLGAISDELKQQNLYPNQATQVKDYQEAVKCWTERGKQCKRKTNLKKVCELCEKIR